MTRVLLLEALKAYTVDAVKDLLLPVKPVKGGTEETYRAPEVHRMRLPDKAMNTEKAPYIIHQMVTGKDMQPPGEYVDSTVIIRSICCVYNQDSEEGSLALLNVIERMRIGFLRERIIDAQFELDLESGLECLIYPDETDPFFVGELISTWKLPTITREVKELWL